MTIRAQSKSSPMITVRLYEWEHDRQGTICGMGIMIAGKPWFSMCGTREDVLAKLVEKAGEVLGTREGREFEQVLKEGL
jgi:hypothetical protein